MPVGVLLALIASLCIARAVLPHGRPVVPRLDDFWRKSSVVDVTPTYTFMELCHDTRALLVAHTRQDRVSVAMFKQLSIYQGIPTCIFPIDPGFRCFSGSKPSAK